VNKSFVGFFRRSLRASRGSLAVLIAIVMVLATATGVALAQDPSTEQATQSQSSTSDPTTSTSDPTTSTSDPTTSTSDSSTTTSDEDGEASDKGTTSEQTTTTSDTLNAIAVAPRDHLSSTTPPTSCEKLENFDFGGVTTTVVVGQSTNTVTLTFTFNEKPGEEDESTGATWTASAPFTGEIIVKSSGDTYTTTVAPPATAGTITSPGDVINGNTQGISYVEICGYGTTTTTGSTTTSTRTTDTTTVTTGTTSTDTSTTDTSTTDTTTTGTGGTAGTTTAGTTPTTPPTQGVAGAVGGGGPSGKAGGGTTSPVAEEAVEAQGGLAFTGLHVPALILIALGTTAAGIVLRKRLEDAA
jgi:hypothetical protein